MTSRASLLPISELETLIAVSLLVMLPLPRRVSYTGVVYPGWTFNGCTSPKYHYLVERNVTDYITVPGLSRAFCFNCKSSLLAKKIKNCLLVIFSEPNTFGLGFDDGPNCTHNAFYNFLQEKNETATMFYIGSNVVRT